MPEKKHKLDIFRLLGKLSTKDREFYDSLTEDEKKSVAPLVVMRWLTGTKDARQIFFLNELVNPFVFNMANHKDLLMKLMLTSTSGRSQRYFWNKAKSKNGTAATALVTVVRDYFKYSSAEASDALPLLSAEDILGYAEELGRQPDEIKAIKKELKERERATISV